MTAQRYLLFAMASGETSQAYAIASHLHGQGKIVTLILKKDVTRGFFADSAPPFPVRMAGTIDLLKQYVEEYKPEVIILCNSKAFCDDPAFWNASSSLFPKQLVVSVDSNWLFLPTSRMYPYNRWMDRYYVNLPPSVFKEGLLERGGTFDIPKSIADRLEPVGCIPAYLPISKEEKKTVRESFGLYKNEKLIFCYVSGFGAGSRSWVFDNLLHAIDELQEPNVRILIFGDVTKIDMDSLKRPDIILPPKTNMDAFYAALASSDLVFQHQGLATLEQALSARVPTIANVTIYPEDEYPELHIGEVKPFAHVGACILHTKTTPISKIAASIHTYLFDEVAIATMKQCQELQWSNGEEELMKRIEKAYEEKFQTAV